jgi:hypothetical protein
MANISVQEFQKKKTTKHINALTAIASTKNINLEELCQHERRGKKLAAT